MNKEEQMQIPSGTWDKLSCDNVERHPQIKFDVNIPVEVVFKDNEPKELPSESGGFYYVFDVFVNKEPRVIMTSAWTLLRALKILSPLKDKKVKIVKKLVKGKQQFEVTLL